jgi:dihydroneopterin aldolase
MSRTAFVELRDLQIHTAIGTYGPGDTVPEAHVLDLTLSLSADWVQIDTDAMQRVFDYDPLIKRIDELARAQPYETQEFLLTRMVTACAAYPQITAVNALLRKSPVLAGTGSLGVRLTVDAEDLRWLRSAAGAQPT